MASELARHVRRRRARVGQPSGRGILAEVGDSAGEVRRFGGWRRELGALLEFVAICGLVVAQPTFELLGENARLLIAWHASTAGALTMTLVVILVPPLASWTVEVL